MSECTHRDTMNPNVLPRSNGCEECTQIGQTWKHLRMCLTCGHVGCCEDSQGQHASAHYGKTDHPLVQSATVGEDLIWCYADDMRVR